MAVLSRNGAACLRVNRRCNSVDASVGVSSLHQHQAEFADPHRLQPGVFRQFGIIGVGDEEHVLISQQSVFIEAVEPRAGRKTIRVGGPTVETGR